MGMAEDEPFFRRDEDIDSGKPCKIPVPRRADGKLGFSIIIQKCSSGNIAKVTQVKDTCLSRELTKYHYITKIDETDIRHLKTPMEVEIVLSQSSGTVVLLEAYRFLDHDSNDDIQGMSFNSSVSSSNSNSSSTNSMNSLLLDADGSCHSQPVARPMVTDTVSLKDAVFQNPDSIQWDAKPKTVILKRSSGGKFGFQYEVLLSTLVPKNALNTSMYFLITCVSNDAARKLKVGDLILSLNGIACQDLSVNKVIDQKIETESELRLIIQRPVKFKHRNNPCVEQKRICPIRRVFLCGPAAMVYYNFLVTRLKSNHHKMSQNFPSTETNLNNDTSAFKASCVWTQGGTFFADSWSKRSWFYHLDVKHLIAVELVASSDESFFHHCMKLAFSKNSIFLIMLDSQQSSATQGSKQAELRMLKRYIHTIQSCVGKNAHIKVKCVSQDNNEQSRNPHSFFIEKIMVEPIVIPSHPDHNSDTFFNSIFEIAKQEELSMSYLASYALYKLYHIGLCKTITTDFFKNVHKVFDKISQQDLHQTVREMNSFKYYIGVNSRKSAQGNSLYVNIEYILNSMSQLAYQPISLVSRSHPFSLNQKISNGIVDQQVLVDNLHPSDVFSHSVLALLESHNLILSLKESGQYACTKYYIPCLQHSYQMEVQNKLVHNVYSLYIQFCSSAQHTDFLRLVIVFGNLYGWELPQEIQLSQCTIMVGKHKVHFQYQWLIQQIKITSEITTQSNEETLFHIFQQVHQVCVAVFPYSFFKYYGRCHNPQCIYCCHPQRKHESPIFCTHLISETQVKQISKVIDIENMSVLELNSKILFHICMELNCNPNLNWRKLAGHLNCNLSLVARYQNSQDPCLSMLVDWHNTSLNSTVINLCKFLQEMKRFDLVKLLEEELDKLRKEQSSDC